MEGRGWGRGGGWNGREGKGGEGGREGKEKGREGKGERMWRGPEKWSAPGPVLALGGPAPSGKILTHPKVLAYVAVTFQVRTCSSITVTCDLRKALSIIGFALKSPTKWCFKGNVGVGAKMFGGKLHPSLELRVFRHLWSRPDAPCSIEFCMGRPYSYLP